MLAAVAAALALGGVAAPSALAGGGGLKPPLIGVISSSDEALVKAGLNGSWNHEYLGAGQIALAYGPGQGSTAATVIALMTSTQVLVKTNGLTGKWTVEYTGNYLHTSNLPVQIAVATFDGGWLLGLVTVGGKVLVKQGPPQGTGKWITEYGSGAEQVAVAGDETDGPTIAVLTDSGTVLAKQPDLSPNWNVEYSNQYDPAGQIALAADGIHRVLLAVIAGGGLQVKEGSLTAPWVNEGDDVDLVAVASSGTHGPLIAIVKTDEEGVDELEVTQGSLTAKWHVEYSDNVWAATVDLSVSSDSANGPVIAFEPQAGPFANDVMVQYGGLNKPLTEVYSGGGPGTVAD